jgi:DNA-binding MarR family transcriptional regulator
MRQPETTDLYMDAIQKFLIIYRYLRSYGRQAHQEGLSGRKISTLRYLSGSGPRAIGQISQYLCIGDSSTSELIAWLQKKGFVTRKRSELDNRVVLVNITPAGQEIIQRTPLGGIPLLRERLKQLPPERLSTVSQTMTDIMRLLEIDYAQ